MWPLLDNIQFIDDRTTVKVRNFLLQNDGSGRFEEVTEQAGAAIQSEKVVAEPDSMIWTMTDGLILSF